MYLAICRRFVCEAAGGWSMQEVQAVQAVHAPFRLRFSFHRRTKFGELAIFQKAMLTLDISKFQLMQRDYLQLQ